MAAAQPTDSRLKRPPPARPALAGGQWLRQTRW